MLVLSRMIQENHALDRFGLFIIYGKQRIGKSIYAILAMKEAGVDWRKHLFFRPEEFLAAVHSAYLGRRKLKVLCLDDAGFGLFAYNWHNPFVKAFCKFTNVAGTVVSNLILTTPNPAMLVKKITNMDAIFIKVMPDSSVRKGAYWRLAKGYRNIMLPSGSKRVQLVFEDRFKCWLPDDEYQEYYEYRYTYVNDSVNELYETLPSLYTIGKRGVTGDSNAYGGRGHEQ